MVVIREAEESIGVWRKTSAGDFMRRILPNTPTNVSTKLGLAQHLRRHAALDSLVPGVLPLRNRSGHKCQRQPAAGGPRRDLGQGQILQVLGRSNRYVTTRERAILEIVIVIDENSSKRI